MRGLCQSIQPYSEGKHRPSEMAGTGHVINSDHRGAWEGQSQASIAELRSAQVGMEPELISYLTKAFTEGKAYLA